MKILALETSATACSVALCEDERLLAQNFEHCGLTHSRTLMPMLEGMLDMAGVPLSEVDVIAVAAGPGSFTGLRIGVSAAKGLAWPGDKPCAGVSTLEAMAWTVAHTGLEVCSVMDARRHQVYNGRFVLAPDGKSLLRLAPDRAIALSDLAEELKKEGKTQILVGDGADLCYTTLKEQGLDVVLAPPHLRNQTAWGVARCALEQARTGQLTDARGLTPSYHRLSQAERERLAREQAAQAAKPK